MSDATCLERLGQGAARGSAQPAAFPHWAVNSVKMTARSCKTHMGCWPGRFERCGRIRPKWTSSPSIATLCAPAVPAIRLFPGTPELLEAAAIVLHLGASRQQLLGISGGRDYDFPLVQRIAAYVEEHPTYPGIDLYVYWRTFGSSETGVSR